MGPTGLNSTVTTADPSSVNEARLLETFDAARQELVSTLTYILGNREDAHDAAQETFLKCWKARHTLDEVQNLRSWVFRVAVNTARDVKGSAWSRRVKTFSGDEMNSTTREPTAQNQIEEAETLEQLRSAIGDLRPDEREVFLLRQNGNMTYDEIAEVRGIPVGTVKTQMRTALIKLRSVLQPAEPRPAIH